MRERSAAALFLVGEVAGEGAYHALGEGTAVIGSGPASHIRLRADGVSRRHALIDIESLEVRLIDQGSKNGTFVNGRRTRSARIEVGDEIAFGPVTLRLEALEPEDGELAISVTAPTEAEPTPAGPGSTLPFGSGTRRIEVWLRVVGRFAERLRRSDGEGSDGLAVVAEELGLRGACLLELAREAEPVVRSTWGEVRRGDVDAACAREAKEEEACWFFVGPDHIACRVRVDRGRAIAVVAWGRFAGRTQSAALWETLLGLHLLLSTEPLPAGEPDPVSPALRFPSGYVLGHSEPMRALYAAMGQLVESEIPVLITGETGAGKELIARALHLSSPRRAGPLVAINCAAIPGELLEAELFGIARGVASGVEGRAGKFERANGGTLFLDEIGEMPPRLQAKLLRVLEERRIHPLGSPPLALDARLIAATNGAIADLMARGALRPDLYYRLAGAHLRVPSLRERRTDIPALVDRRLRRAAEELDKPIVGMTVGALRKLVRYVWPGNVRELDHEMRRLVQICPPGRPVVSGMLSEAILHGGELPRQAVAAGDASEAERVAAAVLPSLQLDELERRAVSEALAQTGGNQVRAARLLGLSRSSLRRRIARYGLA